MIVAGDPPLAVDFAGEGGPLVVFLHGVGGDRSNWAAQLAHFGGWCRAVAVDLRGYGDSGDIEGERRFEDFADDVARTIAHFGGPARVVGLSMGGRIALDLWKRHRACVASLTLADCSAGSAAVASPERIAAFLAARRVPLLEGRTPAELAPEWVRGIAGPNIGAGALKTLIDSHARLRAASYLRTLEAVTRFTDFPPFDAIDVPVLVLTGGEDRQATPAYAATMAAAIPGAKLAVIEGAGHVSNIEAPAAFNAALDGFLRRVA